MKRSALITVFLLVFFSALVIGVVALGFPELLSAGESQPEPALPKWILYPVVRGELTRTHDAAGRVEGLPEDYLAVLTVSKVSASNFAMLRDRGTDVRAGEALYEYKGTKKSVPYPARIIDVTREGKSGSQTVSITLLNYDKLSIVCMIDESRIPLISYSTPVEVKIGKLRLPAKIRLIGYEISDMKLPVYLELPAPYLPGTKASVSFLLSVEPSVLFTDAEALFMVGDDYFANVLGEDRETLRRERVVVGQRFEIEEDDGTVYVYYEVVSGIEEGEILVVETLGGDGKRIREKFGQ